ncbi:MAG TPA: PAS domain-containing protein [Burkholderiales bacterium]|nr:PAS domain-containing protein [Burkholderiales bacterium]
MATATWLKTTVLTVRELMIKRLEAEALGSEEKRDMEMALEELDVMWEELQGQAMLLTRENARYSEFFEFAPDAYVITDAGGNIREANQAALELFRAVGETLAGRPLGSLVPEGDRAAFLAHWLGLVVGETRTLAPWAGRIRTPEGRALAVEFSVRRIPLKKSGAGGICWLIRPAA